MSAPAPCPICGKPLALTRTTTTEILDVGVRYPRKGAKHPVQVVIHCEDGHQAVFPPGIATASALRRLVDDRSEFTDPEPSRFDLLVILFKRVRRGDRIYRREAPGSFPADGRWVHLMREFERDMPDPLEPELAALMDDLEPRKEHR